MLLSMPRDPPMTRPLTGTIDPSLVETPVAARPRPGREDSFDVAVIGAGVVGCALARRFTLEGARVVVVEKALDILDGASKANSAILHTGFDAPPGTLEAECIAAGHAEYREIRERLGLPLIDCGALVVAWSVAERERLPDLIDKAARNGIEPLDLLSPARLRALEPGLGKNVHGGFRVPGEAIVDAWSAPHAYLLQALENGATLERGTRVISGRFDGERWRLELEGRRPIASDLVVNAAGLYGDRLEAALLGESSFEIRPRKGQFIVYDKPAANQARHILLPVPTERTKGIVVCRTAWGNLLVGPTAEEQTARDRATLDTGTLRTLRTEAERVLPGLANETVTAIYAGLRPATDDPAYRIRSVPERRYIGVGGIRSTGLSAALGLARHVFTTTESYRSSRSAIVDPIWPRMPNISDAEARDWERAGNGGIVCHCERVTRREIERCFDDALAPQTPDGLKRRTRATMGRCQGYYCAAVLDELTRDRLTMPFTTTIDER